MRKMAQILVALFCISNPVLAQTGIAKPLLVSQEISELSEKVILYIKKEKQKDHWFRFRPPLENGDVGTYSVDIDHEDIQPQILMLGDAEVYVRGFREVLRISYFPTIDVNADFVNVNFWFYKDGIVIRFYGSSRRWGEPPVSELMFEDGEIIKDEGEWIIASDEEKEKIQIEYGHHLRIVANLLGLN